MDSLVHQKEGGIKPRKGERKKSIEIPRKNKHWKIKNSSTEGNSKRALEERKTKIEEQSLSPEAHLLFGGKEGNLKEGGKRGKTIYGKN